MFQSEPLLWLQAFASGPLTALLLTVSAVGHGKYYLAGAMAIAFGIRFRAGLLLLQLVLWNEIVTSLLKAIVALPRPAEVDASVRLPGGGFNTSPLRSDADGFWSLPDPEAVSYYRALRPASFGFPSGHVSAATTFWTGASVFLRSRPFAIFGACCIALTALSRMYLGRHYLADVAGGLLVGLAVVCAGALTRAWQAADPTRARSVALVSLPLVLVVPGLVVDPLSAGRLVGVTGAILYLIRAGFPDDAGRPSQRLCRVAVALGMYFGASEGIAAIAGWAGLAPTLVGQFAIGALAPPVYLLGAVAIARRLNLYAGSDRARLGSDDPVVPCPPVDLDTLGHRLRRLRPEAVNVLPDVSIVIPVNARGDLRNVLDTVSDIAAYQGPRTLEVILVVNNFPEEQPPDDIAAFERLGARVVAVPNVRKPGEAVGFSARIHGAGAARSEHVLLFDADCRIPDATALVDWYCDQFERGASAAYTHVAYYDFTDAVSLRLRFTAHHALRFVKRNLLGVPTTRGSNYAVRRRALLTLYQQGVLADEMNVGPAFKRLVGPVAYSGRRELTVYTSGRMFRPGWRRIVPYFLYRFRYNRRVLPVRAGVARHTGRERDPVRRYDDHNRPMRT